MSRRTELVITQQGAVRANEATIYAESECIACVDVDLHTKRAKLMATASGSDGEQTVILEADEHTTNLCEFATRESLTHIEFPEFNGWSIYSVSGPARYTLRVVFVREEE